MPKRWNKHISWIVLVSFVVLLSKSLWHDCSHQVHSGVEQGKTTKHSIQQGIEKCYACDLHVPLLSSPLQASGILLKPITIVKISALPASLAFRTADLITLRGPPAC